MKKVVKDKKLQKYFSAVYGSPRSKDELVRLILRERKLKKNEVVFVGDSINDYDGAKKAGVKFVGRLHPRERNPFPKANTETLIKDFNDLEKWLKKVNQGARA
jgi:phosphoglycolate phosphatase-like HAD superfamily hydrolase